jgi:hypothetical protein
VARSTGVILAVGGISFANELVFAPLAEGGNVRADVAGAWRIPVATTIAALALGGLERISPKLSVGLAYISLITVLFARLGSAPAPVENLAKIINRK